MTGFPGSGARGRAGTVLLTSGASLTQVATHSGAAVVATIALGATERGVMVVGATIGSTIAVVVGMGTGAAFRTQLPGRTSAGDRRVLVAAYTWWSAIALGLSAAGSVALTALSAPFVAPGLSDVGLLLSVGVYAAAQVLLSQTVEAWFADGHFRQGSVVAATVAFGGLAAMVAALTMFDSAATLLLAQGTGSVAAWVLLAPRCWRAGVLCVSRVRLTDVARLVKDGAPALGSTIGLAIALRADRYLLGTVAGPAAVGVYSLAASLSEVPRMIPQALGQLFMHDTAQGRSRRGGNGWVLAAIAAAAAGGVVVALVSWPLIPLIFGPEFVGSRELLLILLVAELSFAPYAIANRGLLGSGRIKTAGRVGLGGAVAAIAGYAAAARIAGAAGVAAGSVIVYTGLSLAAWQAFRAARAPAAAGRLPTRHAMQGGGP